MTGKIEVSSCFNDDVYMVSQETIDEQSRCWDEIVKLAEKAGLITVAAGGVMVLMHPNIQIEEGHYHRAQFMSGNMERLELKVRNE